MPTHLLTVNKQCNPKTGQPSCGYRGSLCFVSLVPSSLGFAQQASSLFPLEQSMPCARVPARLQGAWTTPLWRYFSHLRLELCYQAVLTAQQHLRCSPGTPEPELDISSRLRQEVTAATPQVTIHNSAGLRPIRRVLTTNHFWFSPVTAGCHGSTPASHQAAHLPLALTTMFNLL